MPFTVPLTHGSLVTKARLYWIQSTLVSWFNQWVHTVLSKVRTMLWSRRPLGALHGYCVDPPFPLLERFWSAASLNSACAKNEESQSSIVRRSTMSYLEHTIYPSICPSVYLPLLGSASWCPRQVAHIQLCTSSNLGGCLLQLLQL